MNLKYMILAFSLSALTMGCNEDKFLDIKPQGSLNDENLANAEGVEYLITAAYAVGANRGIFYIRAEYPLAVIRIRTATLTKVEVVLVTQVISIRSRLLMLMRL